MRGPITLLVVLMCVTVFVACQTSSFSRGTSQTDLDRSPARYGDIDLYIGEVYQGEEAIAVLGDEARRIEDGWKLVAVEVIIVNTGNKSLYVSTGFGANPEMLDSEGFAHRVSYPIRVKDSAHGTNPVNFVMLPDRGFRVAYYFAATIPEAYEPTAIRLDGFSVRTDTFVWKDEMTYRDSVTLDLANRIPADLFSPSTERGTVIGPVQGFASAEVSITTVTSGKVCLTIKNNGGENIREIGALTSAYDHMGYFLRDERVEIIDLYEDASHLPPGREETYCVWIAGATKPGWQQFSLYIRATPGALRTEDYNTRTCWFSTD